MELWKIQMIAVLVILLLLLIGVLWIRRRLRIRRQAKEKKARTDAAGLLGEQMLLEKVKKLPGRKRLLSNVYIPRANQTTTEIDLILISRKGIFVVENKNMSGHLSGDDDSRTWFHASYQNSFSFYNPILQNRAHIHALMRVLKLEEDTLFHSWIVLSDGCGMRNLKLRQDTYRVMRLSKIRRNYRRVHGKVLLREDIEEIYQRLLPYTRASRRIKKEHMQSIAKRHPV